MSQFSEILTNMSRGRVENDIDSKIMEITKAVREMGQKGTLTLKFDFSLSQHGEMLVSPDVKAKLPAAKIPASIFFIDSDNDRLTREDKRQPELEEIKHQA